MLAPLVEAAIDGDEEAFGALVRAVGDRCMAIAYRILHDADLADDAVQRTFITAWRELDSLRDPTRFEPWVQRMLVYQCYAEARRGRRQNVVRILPLDAPTGADDVLTVHDRDELDRGFRRLPPEQRAVLVFHHYIGLTVPEVAERLGIPLGTAKSRLHYATAALRSALEADARQSIESQERPA